MAVVGTEGSRVFSLVVKSLKNGDGEGDGSGSFVGVGKKND